MGSLHGDNGPLQIDIECLEQLVHRRDRDDLVEEILAGVVERRPAAERNAAERAALEGVSLEQGVHHGHVAVEPWLTVDGPVDRVTEEKDAALQLLSELIPQVVIAGDEGGDAVVGVVDEMCHLVPPRVGMCKGRSRDITR